MPPRPLGLPLMILVTSLGACTLAPAQSPETDTPTASGATDVGGAADSAPITGETGTPEEGGPSAAARPRGAASDGPAAGDGDVEPPSADGPLASALVDRARLAERIVYGQVTATTPGSHRTAAGHAVPTTTVTYALWDAQTHQPTGRTHSITFAGGVLPDGRMALPSGIPLFDRGDVDLLMLRGEGHSGCPLVDCAAGRVRVVDGRIYSDDGHAWTLGQSGLRRGSRRLVATALEHTVGTETLTLLGDAALSQETADVAPVEELITRLQRVIPREQW